MPLISKPIGGDEYYSPPDVVNFILPYIPSEYKKIWCPFDKKESNFVKILSASGYDVIYGHIETGQDFFSYEKPLGDAIISNPPFSKRDAILEKIFEWQIPFALVIPFFGLFDSKKRSDLLRKNDFEILIPRGRMRFYHKERGILNSPNFQSIYLCSKFLNSQLVLSDYTFRRNKDE